MAHSENEGLKRQIGAKALATNAINLTIGAGIFILPAIVAEKLGPSAFLAYLVCGLLIILIMLCFAEIGSKVVTSGGSYAYVENAFGPFAGFLINTLFWFGYSILSDAAIINVMADMLAIWFPSFELLWIRIIFFAGVMGLFSFINIKGAKAGASFVVFTTILKLIPLGLLIVFGIFSISIDNLIVHEWPEFSTLGEVSLILFFAFQGPESALSVSGEIKDPRKNIPKGILLGVAGILFLYILIQIVSQGVLGAELVKFQEAPLAAVMDNLFGPVGATIILIGGVISIFGTLSGDVLATPRVLFAASKDKLLPEFLGNVHPKFKTPQWSIIVFSSLIVIFASAGGFRQLAIYASSATLIIYLAVVLATIKVRLRKGERKTGDFRIPGGLVIHIASILIIGWFLSHITAQELMGLGVFFLGLTGFYFLNKRYRTQLKR